MTRVWDIMMAIGFVAAPHLAAADAGNPPAGAPGVSGPSAPREADRTPSHPHEIVRYGIAQLHAHLNQHRDRDAQRIEAFLGTTIALFFDFETMGRWAAGHFTDGSSQANESAFMPKSGTCFWAPWRET